MFDTPLWTTLADFDEWELCCAMGCFPEDLSKRGGGEVQKWMTYLRAKRDGERYNRLKNEALLEAMIGGTVRLG